ncbi:hypothetical protein B9Z55_016623 [Caenorhabditis nigoni]|uniref:Uncharacterized protein n=1 Tax=Caenorhabditis nigoni TaxID=1611254 RepID=A0A2G5T5H7_9PELO|nr:hypothetical protein B9Z55_016623 [Caenorhabditis nigoni]
MSSTLILILMLTANVLAESGSDSRMCKCPMLKQVDAEVYGQMRGSSKDIPMFAPLDIDYGDNCTSVTITCKYHHLQRSPSLANVTN